MSGLIGLFGQEANIDQVNFKYNPNKQKKAGQKSQQQSPFPIQAPVQLFLFDTAKNDNVVYGQVVLLVRPIQPNTYQLMAYQQQNNPIINFQIVPTVSWILRDQVVAYLKDPQGRQWTLRFADPQTAAKATISIAAILNPIKNNQVSTYDVLTGNGATVTNEDNVTVSYMGFLGINLPFVGNSFDSNEKYNFVIGASNVIKGYSIGVDGMKVGGSRVILLPADFAYGARGAPPQIPPNATLSFLITLKEAVTKNPQPQQPVQQPQQVQQPQPVQQQPQPAQQQPQPVQQQPQPLQHPIQQQPPPQHQQQRQPLFEDNEDDDDDEAVVNTTFIPTIDEEDVLKRLDQLGDLVRSKFDTLVLEAPITLKPRDLVYEVQSLASRIEDQERQLKEQEQLIDELKQNKQNSRLKAELDIAQTELQSLRSVLKGGKDYRRENDQLKMELKRIKDEKLSSLEQSLDELKTQLANAHDISQATAGRKTKELFFTFMGSAIDKLTNIFAGNDNLDAKQVTDQIYEVFHQCSEDTFRQIDERGII